MATTLLTSCPVQALGEIAPCFHLSQLPWSLLQSNHFQTGMLCRFWNRPTQLLRIPANVDLDSEGSLEPPIVTTLLTSSYPVDVDGVQEFVTRMFFHCGGETYFPPAIHLPVALFMHVTVPCGSMHPLPIHWNLN